MHFPALIKELNERSSFGFSPTNPCYFFFFFVCLFNYFSAQLVYSSSEQGKDLDWARNYPQTLVQFLTFLYHNVAEFTTYCATEEFIALLMGTLFRDNATLLMAEDSIDYGGDEVEFSVPCRDIENFIIDHPSRRGVIEFLKYILVDSFHGIPANKQENVTDVILELLPQLGSRREQTKLSTELLETTMEHLLASDVLLTGHSSSLPQTSGGMKSVVSSSMSGGSLPRSEIDFSSLTANLYYFTSRLVDSLWNGLYMGEAQLVFEFLLKLLSQAKRNSSGIATDPLVHSLNRTVLYMLCKPIDSLQVQMNVLDCLGKISTHRSVVFSISNNDAEFLGCLAHLLFMLSVQLEFSNETLESDATEEQMKLKANAQQVQLAAHRVWEEMYIAKKQVLEERLNTSLVPEINAARAIAGEAANGAWQGFVDGEMRGPARDLGHIQHQLQSKIQKVASGISRFTMTKKTSIISKATSGVIANPVQQTQSNANKLRRQISLGTLNLWMQVHVSLIRELVRQQGIQYTQWHEHVTKWSLAEWRGVEEELTRERGLWGPEVGGKLDKWTLDTTEGPCRMRKKLVPNSSFYFDFPYRPNLDLPENKNLRCKVGISRDSKEYCERMQSVRPRTMDSRILDVSLPGATPSEDKTASTFLFKDMGDVNASMIRRASTQNKSTSLDEDEDGEKGSPIREVSQEFDAGDKANAEDGVSQNGSLSTQTSTAGHEERTGGGAESETRPSPKSVLPESKGPDNQTLLRLLEEGEELVSMFRCARIEGLETWEGLLLFGKEHYYVVDGFTLLKTREIRDLDFLPESLHDPIVPYTACGTTRMKGDKRLCAKFPYEDIREVHKRRYLLQPISLEVFSADGRNHLLAFPKRTRNKVYTKFISVAKSLTESGASSVSGQRSSAALEQSGSSSLFSSLIGETSVTQRWVRGEISNFQYLMHLNTLAGRSYNDLSQYPVFPWVLADYTSDELDLNNPETFRDLSKSMGAQTDDRLEQFLKRYREWDDPTGETPPYMFGTHYSSAMIVVSYLVRLEPFTQQFLKLQGGHFDLADRMFHSIGDCWMSASKNNMADVKELVPEFFYLPEFLVNTNNYDLGVKQSGVVLEDVVLPAWAKGDSREFIRLHREALECDFVSAHLHLWIDLIFGHKQQGQPAIDGHNLFHHLFYEGNVDFEAIEDPLTRNATIGFINNFGQIPSQLFKKPHPAKKIPGTANSRGGSGIPLPLPVSSDSPFTQRYIFHSLDTLKPPAQPVKEIRGTVGQMVQNEKGHLCAVEGNKVLMPPNYNRFISWGFPDNSIRFGNYDSDKSSCIYELSDCGEIVCAACPNNRTLVTGSTNTVVSVWELIGGKYRSSSSGYSLRLRKSLYGHTEPIICIAASGDFGLAVSGSRDGTCIMWDLSNCSFIRQLRPHSAAVSAVAINPATGDIASSSGCHLYLWDINGQLLAMCNTLASSNPDSSKAIIYSLAFTTINEWDAEHVIMSGTSDGVMKMWSLEYVQVSEADAEADKLMMGAEELEPINNLSPIDPVKPELLHQRLLIQQRMHLNSLGSSGDTPIDPTSSRGWSLDVSPEPISPLPPDSGFATPICSRSFSLDQSNSLGFVRSTEVVSWKSGGSANTISSSSQSSNSAAGAAAGSSGNAASSSTQNNSNSSAGSNPKHPNQINRAGSNDSFVFVNREGVLAVKTVGKLKPGFLWSRQLVFRSKLTMHTAFERKDNISPAAITAIAPSRDHKSLFVGDSRGRIWAWVIGDEKGGRADHWQQDLARHTCTQCHQRFTLAERKHHCRNCGQIFCAKCSRFESEIRHMKISKPVRVCQNCFVRLRAETTLAPPPNPTAN